ncbi:MAG TPA: SDR family NAD(P)-dependent oxidoreductase [Anaeromyxobacteraceae bacterium]|nr:SDR family NAD(P)-dependent oxidoreductase [Anaeromyxobacteraceae bacterium]
MERPGAALPPSDRACLVTGTSSGIGLAVARELLERGWDVAGIARRPAPLHHPRYRHLRLDLADVARLESEMEGAFGDALRLDGRARVGLVNGAATLEPVGPTGALPAAGLARAFAVNAVAPAWLLGFFLRRVRGRPLRVVNVSSGAARRPYAGWSAYCSTKAALRMAGEVVGAEAREYAPGTALPTDVALVSYEPGVVDTEMQAAVRGAVAEAFPQVRRFLDLHASGQLHHPSKPAAEIADLLGSDGLPPFSERRLGG